MKEKWKNIKGFERYSISNLGRVKNNITGKVLKQRDSRNGYLRIGLRKGDVKYETPTTIHTHRLVAEHFIGIPKGDFEVNHINGIKHDNNVNNLEWVTASANINHAIKKGLISKERMAANIKNITSEESKRKSDESHRTPEYRKKMQKINKDTGVTKTVLKIDLITNKVISKYDNCHEAARSLFQEGFTNQDRLISRVARGIGNSAYGFKWKYE